MNKLLVSACLLGSPVRYDGQSKAVLCDALSLLVNANRVITFCPEVAAGLCTPRDPAEIQFADGAAVIDGKTTVLTRRGADVTRQFVRGANLALELCIQHHIRVAVLTESSPSCGSSLVYDGSFSRKKITGMGVTSALLRRHGIRVYSQHQIGAAIDRLDTDTLR